MGIACRNGTPIFSSAHGSVVAITVRKEGTMRARKRIGLVAHDGRKRDLAEWVKYNEGTLSRHDLWATGTTGGMLESVCPIV